MPHAAANAFGDLLHIVEFFQETKRKNEAIALFEIQFERFGNFDQFTRILEVLLVIGFQDFVALQFAVGQSVVFFRSAGRGKLIVRILRLGRKETGGQCRRRESQERAPNTRMPYKSGHLAIITESDREEKDERRSGRRDRSRQRGVWRTVCSGGEFRPDRIETRVPAARGGGMQPVCSY